MITADNMMKSYKDTAWFHEYARAMGKSKFYAYANKLFEFLHSAAPGKIEIEPLVKFENEDLFAKCVCWFIYENILPIHFSDDYQSIIKIDI